MATTPINNQHLRKTRIVVISDTHNASPKDGAFKLPKGDVLIHAGDCKTSLKLEIQSLFPKERQ